MPEQRARIGFAIIAILALAVTFPRAASAEDNNNNRMEVELLNGDRVFGTLLKRDATKLYIYVGGRVITLDQEQIKSIRGQDGNTDGLQDVKKFRLYHTAKRPIKSIQELVKELGPAIVVVKTPSGLGTGWFCNQDGYLITNHHVIAGERSITVTLFPREGDGFGKKVFKKVRIVALNDDIDLALLKIEEPIDVSYPQLYLGDSSKLKVGDKSFAIGNPMGLERSTSQGNVSKVARNFAGRLYVQTTAPIAPGNSGGPLFNDRGEVIGVVNMGYIMLDGLGFAIPSKYVKEFLDNVEAFAYDEDNPNAGMQYMEVPITATDGSISFTASDFIKTGRGISSLTLVDLNGDGAQEVVFANNNKAEVGIIRLRRRGEVEKPEEEFADINRIQESERFKLVTIPVTSRITSLAVADLNGDRRPDIAFLGDKNALYVLDQNADGTFKPARKLDDIRALERRTALRIIDLDGDGEQDIFVLGPERFTVLRSGRDRRDYPLNRGYSDRIRHVEIQDVNGDGRLDLIFFAWDKLYAAYVRLQNAAGDFVDEIPLRSHISGPITSYRRGPGIRFLTLDKGKNRVRELHLVSERAANRGQPFMVRTAIPVDPAAGIYADVELGDLDGDGRLEIVATDRKRNEFVVYSRGEDGFTPVRSPSPQDISQAKLFIGPGRKAALFSFSRKDKLFGVSRVKERRVSYPRPINTEGQVQFMKLAKIFGDDLSLIWVEKVKSRYVVRAAPAAKLLRRIHQDEKGSLDIESQTLLFGPDEKKLSPSFRGKPKDFAIADFNGDGVSDLVVYWAYSGRESLYLGLGEGRFREIIKEQDILDEQKGQPLIVEDIDGDGKKDVLLVRPGFVRVLRVDFKGKLYVDRQFNWEFGHMKRLIRYERTGQTPRFLAISGPQAQIVELDLDRNRFRRIRSFDLSGVAINSVKIGNVDGDSRPDILVFGRGVMNIFAAKSRRLRLASTVVLNAKLDTFNYWNLRAEDLDGDGQDEVLLFDSRKAVFEILRADADGQLKPILRHRLFEKSILQQDRSDSLALPQEMEVGDVDGDGRPDFICILQDRIALYLQRK